MENNAKKTNVDTTALALLLLAKVIARSSKVKLTKKEKYAFAQIASMTGNILPAFGEMPLNDNEEIDL